MSQRSRLYNTITITPVVGAILCYQCYRSRENATFVNSKKRKRKWGHGIMCILAISNAWQKSIRQRKKSWWIQVILGTRIRDIHATHRQIILHVVNLHSLVLSLTLTSIMNSSLLKNALYPIMQSTPPLLTIFNWSICCANPCGKPRHWYKFSDEGKGCQRCYIDSTCS